MSALGMPDRRRRSGGSVVVGMALVVLLVVVAVVVELVAPAGAPPAAETRIAQPPAASGVWYCPATAGEEESAVVTVAAAGDVPTEATLVRYGAEGQTIDEPVEVAPGTEASIPLDPAAAAQPVAVRWRGGPAVASWRVDGDVDTEAPCPGTPSPTWHVAGLDTDGDTRSTLHLFNPFTADAVARIVFGTAEGREALVLTDQIVVRAGSALRVDVDEVQPEVRDLAATVEVQSGRLVAQGEVRYASGGRALVSAVGSGFTDAALRYGRADDATTSYLSVYNPEEREAAVEVTVSDPRLDGTSLPAELAVPAGAVVRVPLEDASEAQQFGVAVRSLNGVGVVTTRTTSEVVDEQRRVGVASAVPPAREWMVAGAATEGRLSRLHLFNPGSEPVTVTVAAEGAPAEWSAIVVEPNAYERLDVGEAGTRPDLPLRLTADGPFVPQLYTRMTDEPFSLWTPLGVPARAWRGPASRPAVQRDPLLGREPVELRTEDADEDLGPLPEVPAPADEATPPAEDGDSTEAPPEGGGTEDAGTEAPDEGAATEGPADGEEPPAADTAP